MRKVFSLKTLLKSSTQLVKRHVLKQQGALGATVMTERTAGLVFTKGLKKYLGDILAVLDVYSPVKRERSERTPQSLKFTASCASMLKQSLITATFIMYRKALAAHKQWRHLR